MPGDYEEGRGAGFVASGAEDGMVPWAFGRQNSAKNTPSADHFS